jgi:hypothetical protein
LSNRVTGKGRIIDGDSQTLQERQCDSLRKQKRPEKSGRFESKAIQSD